MEKKWQQFGVVHGRQTLAHIMNGENTLEIQVVNSLNNRMVGDASLPESKRVTYAYPEITTPNNALVPSGIMQQVLLVKRFQ